MQRLKILLQSNNFYIIFLLFLIIYVFLNTFIIKYQTKFLANTTYIEASVQAYKIDDDKITLFLKEKELFRATYYFKNNSDLEYFQNNLKIGITLKIYGKESPLLNNTIPNTFNYKKYLYNNHIYYNFLISKIDIINKKVDIISNIKNIIRDRIKLLGDNPYLNAFILGDKTSIDSDTYSKIKNNGVSHLFALSGMHLSLIYILLEKILSKIKYKKVIIYPFILFYLMITGFSVSFTRAIIFLFLLELNKKLKLDISRIKVLLIIAFIIILINPFVIYNVGFWYTFIITFSLLYTSSKLKNKSKFKQTILVSVITFLFSLPINIYLNYEVNLISIISNIILVPLVSMVVFPLALITFVFSFLMPLFNIVIFILEGLNNILAIIKINIIFGKINILEIIIYYILLIFLIELKNKKNLIILIIFLLFLYNKNLFNLSYNVYFLDVGQGDSALFVAPFNKEVILIDTGGKVGGKKDFSKDNIILFLKSLRIRKIDLLIVTHGDYDHLGNAIFIGNSIPYKKVLLNKNSKTEEEQKLIDKFKEIASYKSKTMKVNFLNDKIYDNENDSSIVTKINIYNHTFLLMGDASIKVEEELISKYDLGSIDFLKVGHHGSKTSSSISFINDIKPKYALISVGRNNRYGHPNKEVLDNLNSSNIYRTDLNGTIKIKLNKNGYKVNICPP